MNAALGFILLACSGVACWFAGSETRAGDHANLPTWLRVHGRRLAVMLAVLQLGLSVPLLGVAIGPLLLCLAWMVIGNVFVACVNAWPQRTIQAGLFALVPAVVLILASL
ncbi:hypothetical protein [uncultured Oxalicibacterium sp.]|uniref:hypothetical protein n=1 Tax=uncultured Oxalicibacterium sp. TaxID=1168540 RepID=UPI0025FCD668|nr:hypothetical protein [uncultured Oxalicibacterium sp.]